MSGIIITEKKEGVCLDLGEQGKISSMEELAYYLNHHLYSLGEDFFREEFFDFLNGLGEINLASGLSLDIAGKKSYLLLANRILQTVDYYSAREKKKIEEEIYTMLHRPPAQNQKIRGDLKYEAGDLYGAWKEYKNMMEYREVREDDELCAGILNRTGVIQARFFLYEEALDSLNRAMDYKPQEKYRRNLIHTLVLAEDGPAALSPEMLSKKKKMFALKFRISEEEFEEVRREKEKQKDKIREEEHDVSVSRAKECFFAWREEYRKLESER